ncbi:transcriptional repressor LexA [Beggiatoa alba]|nr:transcriptional repressor LexA [Beggiatoa alba]
MQELTEIQRQILDFIRECLQEWQMPPTMHEIAEYMGYRSDNAAYQHLNALQRKGYIELGGHSRGITLLEETGIPVVGKVAAGAPLLAAENIEMHIDVAHTVFHPQAHYLLRVQGMSMCEIGILDGDLLAVHKTKVAETNQIIVARIDEEVTVKRFRQRGNIVTLLPENVDFDPIRVDLREQAFAIEGRMVGLIRQ